MNYRLYNSSLFLLISSLLLVGGCQESLPDYQNPQLSFDQRADDLMSRMTLEEKAALMGDISYPRSRWGRGQETYGEDPYLTSRMGVQVVKGLQGPEDAKYRKLLACAKHYAVHSGPEWSRHELNLDNVDSRDLWETYLSAFKPL